MTKTKFLSRVLAVLMVLSMLCSTGVFADYDSGLLAGEASVTGTITDNGTATVSCTLATASGGKTWVTNPVILIDTNKYPNAVLEVIECKVDGVAVPVDYSVKDVKCWGEGTGIYSETECMRGAGYNEWGDKFIPACNGLTSIEYTVKLDLDGDGYGSDAAGGANTGVAPVAALAVATLAGAALVATKKR